MIIRRAVASDARNIVNVNITSRKDTYKGILPDDFLDSLQVTEESINKWQNSIRLMEENKQRLIIVAEEDGVICGFAAGGKPKQENMPCKHEVYGLYILPNHQRQGIGRKLLHQFRKETGGVPFFLYMLEDNAKASKFYERCGGQLQSKYRTLNNFGNVEKYDVMYLFTNVK